MLTIHKNPVTVREVPPFGININYLRDDDSNRPQARPMATAVSDAGMRFLRYPGGGKSNHVLFFDPPHTNGKPMPLTKPYSDFSKQANMMEFDTFIELCKKTGCQPHVVVGCGLHLNINDTDIDIERFFYNAVEWVRYANVKMGYGVKYWEIGNENWNKKKYNASEFGDIISRFAKAMKEVDPTILIGASGKDEDWWQDFLPKAAADIDFLTISEYACWGYRDYETYAYTTPNMTKTAEEALDCIEKYAPEHKDRLFVAVAEFNARDYAWEFEGCGWYNDNNLGHALANIDMCGQMALNEKIKYGMIWTTRWMHQRQQHDDIFYGFDANNGLMPSTMCLYLWGRFMRKNVLEVTGIPEGLTAFASADERGLTVFLINKRVKETEVKISGFEGINNGAEVKTYLFTGNNPNDLYPEFRQKESSKWGETYTLPPYSCTVLCM
jgi:alpha-L-arabinofuranosidase